MVTWWLGTWMLTNFWYISTFITSSDRTDTTAIKVLPQTFFQKRNGLPSDQGGQITMCALMCVFEWAFCKDFKLHWLQEKDNKLLLSSVNNADRKQERWMSHRLAFDVPLTTRLSYQLQKLVFGASLTSHSSELSPSKTCLSQQNRSFWGQGKGSGMQAWHLTHLSFIFKNLFVSTDLSVQTDFEVFGAREYKLDISLIWASASQTFLCLNKHLSFKPVQIHTSKVQRKRKPPNLPCLLFRPNTANFLSNIPSHWFKKDWVLRFAQFFLWGLFVSSVKLFCEGWSIFSLETSPSFSPTKFSMKYLLVHWQYESPTNVSDYPHQYLMDQLKI